MENTNNTNSINSTNNNELDFVNFQKDFLTFLRVRNSDNYSSIFEEHLSKYYVPEKFKEGLIIVKIEEYYQLLIEMIKKFIDYKETIERYFDNTLSNIFQLIYQLSETCFYLMNSAIVQGFQIYSEFIQTIMGLHLAIIQKPTMIEKEEITKPILDYGNSVIHIINLINELKVKQNWEHSYQNADNFMKFMVEFKINEFQRTTKAILNFNSAHPFLCNYNFEEEMKRVFIQYGFIEEDTKYSDFSLMYKLSNPLKFTTITSYDTYQNVINDFLTKYENYKQNILERKPVNMSQLGFEMDNDKIFKILNSKIVRDYFTCKDYIKGLNFDHEEFDKKISTFTNNFDELVKFVYFPEKIYGLTSRLGIFITTNYFTFRKNIQDEKLFKSIVFCSVIITILHEFAHFSIRYKEDVLKYHTPRVNFEDEFFQEGGKILEKTLFGRVITEIYYQQISYICDTSNWEKDIVNFREDFIALNDECKQKGDEKCILRNVTTALRWRCLFDDEL